jgi:hypothetical protein
MAEFLGDIAGMLEIFAVAAGLVLLHRASKEAPAKLLQAAGVLLIVGGLVAGACTGWYWFQYRAAGDFERAMPMHSMMGAPSMPGMPGMPGMNHEPAAE